VGNVKGNDCQMQQCPSEPTSWYSGLLQMPRHKGRPQGGPSCSIGQRTTYLMWTGPLTLPRNFNHVAPGDLLSAKATDHIHSSRNNSIAYP